MAQSIGEVKGYISADNTAFIKALEQSENKARSFAAKTEQHFKAIGREMEALGKSLSLKVTAPILAAGTAMAKTAIDAEETRNKFSAVFSSIETDAKNMAETLRSAYGLGRTESQQLLADTGDLLTGFDFTQQQALDLSFAVQKLAVDLTSFQNVEGGAERASMALTKALLGETESAKALGIVIRQDSEEFKTLVARNMAATGATLTQAKAMAILEIATNQSKNAIGDYARTADSTSNLLRLLWTRIKDAAEEIGEKLVPATRRLTLMGLKAIEMFERLSPATLETVIQVAALAAAAGPALLIMGKMSSSIGSIIGVARTFLPIMGGVVSTMIAAVAPIAAVAAAAALVWGAFGDLIPVSKSVSSATEWIQKAFKATATFFTEFKSWWFDSNAEISESTRTAIDFIAKTWLSLKFAWNAVQVGLQTLVQGIVAGFEKLLAGTAAVAEWLGLEDLSKGAKNASKSLQDFVLDVEDVKTANLETMQAIQDSWGNAPEQLKADAKAFTETIQTLGEQAFQLLESSAPGAIESVKKLIASINEIVAAGDAGAIQIPVEAGGGEAPAAAPLPMTMGAGETSGLAFLRQREDALQAHHDLMLQKEFEFAAAWAEQERERFENNKNAWDLWLENSILTMQKAKDFAAEMGVDFMRSFSSAMASVILGTKKFSAVMTSLFQSMSQKLLEEAINHTLAMIAWAYAAAIGKAVGSAPNPWLIPVYVAAAVAFSAAAMSGTVAGSGSVSGGGGGATAAATPEPATQSATVSRIETNAATASNVVDTTQDMEPADNDGIKRVVVESEFGDKLMEFSVKETLNGKGDGVHRFLTTRDIQT